MFLFYNPLKHQKTKGEKTSFFEQQEWEDANNSTKINRNSTKIYQPFASRNKFKLIYIKPLELKEDYVILANTRYPDINHHIKNATTSIVPSNTNFNNAVKFSGKTYIPGTSIIKGIRRSKFNSKLNRCGSRFRPFMGATLNKQRHM